MSKQLFKFAPYNFRLVNSVGKKKLIAVDKEYCTDEFYAIQLGLIKFYAIRLLDLTGIGGYVLDWQLPTYNNIHELKFIDMKILLNEPDIRRPVWVMAK